MDVIYRNGKWIANVLLQRKLEREPSSISHKLGLDLGVKHTVTTSDGRYFDLPFDKLAKLDKLKRKYQRKKSKAVKKSCAYYHYIALIIAKVSHKIANIRRDWQRKLIHLLVMKEQFHHVIVEKLNIASMSKSAKGSVEQHGKNVAQKSSLNCLILEQGWSQFITLLSQKLGEVGGTLVQVNPKFTSQTCSCCGHKSAKNRPSQAEFLCVKCGFRDNADVNAARNILKKGEPERFILCAKVEEKLNKYLEKFRGNCEASLA